MTPGRAAQVGNTWVTITADIPFCNDNEDVVVSIGDVEATVEVVTSHQILVRTGPVTDDITGSPVDVVVDSPSYGKAKHEQAFTYQARMCSYLQCCKF